MRTRKIMLASMLASSICISEANAQDLRSTNLLKPISVFNTNQISTKLIDKAVSKKTRTINGKLFTFTKYLNNKGETYTKVFDSKNRLIDERSVPKARYTIADKALLEALEKSNGKPLLINIALNLEPLIFNEKAQSAAITQQEGQIIEARINNKRTSEKVINAMTEQHIASQHELSKRMAEHTGNQVQEWLKRYDIKINDTLKQAINNGDDVLTTALEPEQIKQLIESQDSSIAGIELYTKPEDTITAAMVDTSISSSALPYSSTRGDDIGIYMTESGCANESRITNYDRLSGSETNHSRNVGAIIRAVSPDSFLYCRGSAVLPQDSDLDGVGGNPDIYVVNRSNGSPDMDDYRTSDRDWDNFVYDHNVATFISAGNEGGDGDEIISPAKGHNIVTVGNYNDADDTIWTSSSFEDPDINTDKPEISAPGRSITAGGFTMTGTSMSSPHAAGFAADMMSSSTYLKLRPYLVKAKIMAGATDPISGGFDKVGVGGIDFASAQWSGYYSWHTGSNSSFTSFANNDGNPDQYIERRVYISRSYDDVRIALSWLNRGTYTYNNRNDAHPIGMDLDMRVYDPYGNYIGGSFSWDNNFETLDFEPTVSGYYTIKVNRYANRDTSLNLRMGLYVNYYN